MLCQTCLGDNPYLRMVGELGSAVHVVDMGVAVGVVIYVHPYNCEHF